VYNVCWKGGDRKMFPNDKYFEIYAEVLKVIQHKDVQYTEEILDEMFHTSIIKDNFEEYGQKNLEREIFRTLDNLIADGLVKGRKQQFLSGHPGYDLDGLTTSGHTYLSSIENDNTWRRIKEYIKLEGIPTTPTTITKAIANII
jgi:hypothetical protein